MMRLRWCWVRVLKLGKAWGLRRSSCAKSVRSNEACTISAWSCASALNQSDAGSAGIFSRRTNRTQYAR
eukprot:620192-Prorocentrum_minimum.AAC.1